jgi:Na+/proline symporter/nitrogen-specific signal transduction histidine kinase
MISSRYGKSATLAAVVTVIALITTTPYIALQLKAVTTSFDVIDNSGPDPLSGLPSAIPDYRFGFWIAVGMAVFAILFGTRNIDAKERHHGVVAAIAVEAIVKLVALVAVGVMVVYGIGDGPASIFAHATPQLLQTPDMFGPRWITLTFLSAAAVVCLPREFQVMVVENFDEQHLRTASWLFPLYLFLITLFVLPIAIAGLGTLPAGSNPDMFVLTLPMWARQEGIALLAFLGGFSSATSMVIVACIALSTMLSNHIIMPVALKFGLVSLPASGEIRRFLLTSRRIGICVILLLGFLYFRLSGTGGELASIGLIAFAGVAQVLPSLLGGLFWRRANAGGAVTGLVSGALLWAYTLFLPSFAGGFIVPHDVIANGPFGIAALRPQALFGLAGVDPLVHSLFWSLAVNTLLFVGVSLVREQRPLERLQSTLFVDVFRTPEEMASGVIRRSATAHDLSILAERILGGNEALATFRAAARAQGLPGNVPIADNTFITQLERKLAGSVGAASAHALISQVVGGETISLDELMKIADETQQVREYSRRLEEKSRELEATASQLSAANERLTRLDAEKDDFLSQVSHEVRTPMTSIRSFTELLLDEKALEPDRSAHFLQIIHDESVRLTRLLDSTLDLSLLERGEAPWRTSPIDPEVALESSIRACSGLAANEGVRLVANERAHGVKVEANGDRLAQVFINLISNAIKYNTSDDPELRIESRLRDGVYEVLFCDNGPGIGADEQEKIFSKFMRGAARTRGGAAGAGLGLAISSQIMRRLGGSLTLEPRREAGACFRVALAGCRAGERSAVA